MDAIVGWFGLLSVILVVLYALRNTEGSGCFSVVVLFLFVFGTLCVIVGPEAMAYLTVAVIFGVPIYCVTLFPKRMEKEKDEIRPYINAIEADPDIIEKYFQRKTADMTDAQAKNFRRRNPNARELREFKMQLAREIGKSALGKNYYQAVEDIYKEMDERANGEAQ